MNTTDTAKTKPTEPHAEQTPATRYDTNRCVIRAWRRTGAGRNPLVGVHRVRRGLVQLVELTLTGQIDTKTADSVAKQMGLLLRSYEVINRLGSEQTAPQAKEIEKLAQALQRGVRALSTPKAIEEAQTPAQTGSDSSDNGHYRYYPEQMGTDQAGRAGAGQDPAEPTEADGGQDGPPEPPGEAGGGMGSESESATMRRDTGDHPSDTRSGGLKGSGSSGTGPLESSETGSGGMEGSDTGLVEDGSYSNEPDWEGDEGDGWEEDVKG